ncbi:unnamed protein product, partial [Ilex paraguariensis]
MSVVYKSQHGSLSVCVIRFMCFNGWSSSSFVQLDNVLQPGDKSSAFEGTSSISVCYLYSQSPGMTSRSLKCAASYMYSADLFADSDASSVAIPTFVVADSFTIFTIFFADLFARNLSSFADPFAKDSADLFAVLICQDIADVFAMLGQNVADSFALLRAFFADSFAPIFVNFADSFMAITAKSFLCCFTHYSVSEKFVKTFVPFTVSTLRPVTVENSLSLADVFAKELEKT